MKNLKYIGILNLILFALAFSSCADKIQTEWGNSTIYFSNITPSFALSDSASIADYQNQADSIVYVAAVYRSGIVDKLEAITVNLELDSTYLQTQIDLAQTLPANQQSDIMVIYKSSRVIGNYYCSVPSSVTIPSGERRAVVPIVIKRARVKLLDNNYLNYSRPDFVNTGITKDKKMAISLRITSNSSNYPVLEKQNRCFVGITKSLLFPAP